MLSESAIAQRVRRACTNGKKKKALGGPEAVTLYKDSDNRDALTEMLIAAHFQKDAWNQSISQTVYMSMQPMCIIYSSSQGEFPEPGDEVCRTRESQDK